MQQTQLINVGDNDAHWLLNDGVESFTTFENHVYTSKKILLGQPLALKLTQHLPILANGSLSIRLTCVLKWMQHVIAIGSYLF